MLRPHAAIQMAALFACVSQISWEMKQTAAVFNLTSIGLLVQEGQQRENPHVKVIIYSLTNRH